MQYMKLCRPYWFFIALDACSDVPFSACRYRAAAAVGDSARATRGSALPQDGRDGRQDSCTGIVRRFCVTLYMMRNHPSGVCPMAKVG